VTGHVLASLTWDPGFRGILVVVVGVAVLCGSVFVILATNSGVRLGFLIALAGLFGWLSVMGAIWSMYGIGYKGPAPTWKVAATIRGNPADSDISYAETLPLPEKLLSKYDPVKLRDSVPEFAKEYPKSQPKVPTIGDLVGVDAKEGSDLRAEINKSLDGKWTILASTNKYYGETQSTVAEALGSTGQNIFANGASDYVVIDSFLRGGKKGLGDDRSILNRIKYKITSPFDLNHEPFRAAIQLQAVVPQTTKAGQAPPTPVRDPKATVYTIILERDHGALRLPSIVFTIVCLIVFGICANMLHRRDRLATAQRAAAGA
jgi:hypothetical protein